MTITTCCEVGGKELVFETGRLAKQADGAVTARMGDTIVLSCACSDPQVREGIDFFPLTVDYREKYSAAGKYPGGFFKREGRPTEKEILTSRLIDRPIRPLFPEGFLNEVQVMVTTLSADNAYDPDVLAMNASFAALAISSIPFEGMLGAVRIGRIGDEFILFPTYAQLAESTLNLTVAAGRDAIVMVEGGARELPESLICDALALAQQEIAKIIEAIAALVAQAGKPKCTFAPPAKDETLAQRVRELAYSRMQTACFVTDKQQRQSELDAIAADVIAAVQPEGSQEEDRTREIKALLYELEGEILRQAILREGRRADGRDLETVRPISIEVGCLPRTHGSALFTRGQTQALVTVTLGTASDEQIIDSLTEETTKKFMLHYNFPPFSVGEVRPIRGPGRREIGHGALAERALAMVMPPHDSFPYTVRINSDILESNGSSSMATVCGGCLALMDAGVPLPKHVAGVAMGLIAQDGQTAILTDILGVEDHLGDMDFKICGTTEGVTAVQMDIKISGLDRAVMERALAQARRARLHILEEMRRAIVAPRESLSPYAPKIETFMIPIDRIRDVIGPGGKVIRGIIAETGVKIDIEDNGKVVVAGVDPAMMEMAIRKIKDLTAEVEVGAIYTGKVVRIVPFGCFVEILPGQDGLVHISKLAPRRVEKVEDVVREGDVIEVKVVEIDGMGRVNLSKVDADVQLGRIEAPIHHSGDAGDRGDRGDRGTRGGKDRGDRHRQDRDRGDRGGHRRRH